MMFKTLVNMRDLIHAQFCYHLFITPVPYIIEEKYRDFAARACEFISNKRSTTIERYSPRHYVIHHFAQTQNPAAKKILITHGWMSRAAFMVKFIRSLHQQGYDVYALDFPAHGDAKGLQLTWTDAVMILKEILDQFGPFYAVIGHSFGGSMLLNTLILASQFPEWQLKHPPEKMVMIASPIRMRTPVSRVARQCRLNAGAYRELRNIFRQKSFTKIEHLNFRHFVRNNTLPILCIHGSDDLTITPRESILFCQRYPYANLKLIPGIDHVDILIDQRVEKEVMRFLASDDDHRLKSQL